MLKVLFLETGVLKISDFISLMITHQVCFIQEGLSKDLIVILALFLVSLYAVFKLFYSNYLNLLYKSSYNYGLSYEMFLETSSIPFRIKSAVLYLGVLAVSSYTVSAIYYAFLLVPDSTFVWQVLQISAAISVWLISRMALLKFLGYVGETESLFNEYNHSFFNNFRIIALPYTAIFIILVFGNQLVKPIAFYLGLFLAGAIMLHTWYRGILIARKFHVEITYKLLFFLSFEIMPIALLVSIIYSFI